MSVPRFLVLAGVLVAIAATVFGLAPLSPTLTPLGIRAPVCGSLFMPNEATGGGLERAAGVGIDIVCKPAMIGRAVLVGSLYLGAVLLMSAAAAWSTLAAIGGAIARSFDSKPVPSMPPPPAPQPPPLLNLAAKPWNAPPGPPLVSAQWIAPPGPPSAFAHRQPEPPIPRREPSRRRSPLLVAWIALGAVLASVTAFGWTSDSSTIAGQNATVGIFAPSVDSHDEEQRQCAEDALERSHIMREDADRRALEDGESAVLNLDGNDAYSDLARDLARIDTSRCTSTFRDQHDSWIMMWAEYGQLTDEMAKPHLPWDDWSDDDADRELCRLQRAIVDGHQRLVDEAARSGYETGHRLVSKC